MTSKAKSFLLAIWAALAALLSRNAQSTTTTSSDAVSAEEAVATPTPQAEASDEYTKAGDASVDGIYAHFAEGDTEATKPYDKIDPTQYPKVWVRRTGIAVGNLVYALRVDGRNPSGKEEYMSDDVDAVGEHGVVVLPYPKYDLYRSAGTHEVVVLVGRVKDGETDPSTMEVLHEYPFDVTVVKV